MIIREYREIDELSWIRCRVLSFLSTSYFDDVMQNKERYKNPAIELVAEFNGKIIGILDIEYERIKSEVCYLKGDLGATIWNLAVLPEYQQHGIALKMLDYAKAQLINLGIKRIEVWTQDDEIANTWYQGQGFSQKFAYLNAFIKGNQVEKYINTESCKETFGVRSLNFEAPLNKKSELEKVCYRLHEVRLYEMKL